jgi:hypothetical protein
MGNAGFTVHTDSKSGKVTVTVAQNFNQGELKQILAQSGIRAYFSTTVLPAQPGQAVPIVSAVPCTWVGAGLDHSTGINSVMSVTPGSPDTNITIDPSKMPSGSVLAFAFEYLGDVHHEVGLTETLLAGEPTGCIATQ